MPYLPTAQSFLTQSTLLISARPTTTRITTKYTLPHPSPPPHPTRPKSHSTNPPTTTDPATTKQPYTPPRKPTLTLKTYDPVSGTCLKYRTDKAAEVGRLVGVLGACGGVMAGLPPQAEKEAVGREEGDGEVEVEGVVKVEGKEGVGKGGGKEGREGKEGKGQVGGQGGKGGAGGGGVGGKKKKGKK